MNPVDVALGEALAVGSSWPFPPRRKTRAIRRARAPISTAQPINLVFGVFGGWPYGCVRGNPGGCC
ncbi:hypothetical protein [Streptosporangium sp. NPDC049376]|uniref:hypothetical protein n=1 Tax=Streptosporangium sp. NPDC049376 TaxID=3366192 RepID=UPI0037B134AF